MNDENTTPCHCNEKTERETAGGCECEDCPCGSDCACGSNCTCPRR